MALYRDGCKASQPLSTGGEKKKDREGEAAADTLTPEPLLAPMPRVDRAQAQPQLTLNIAPNTRLYGQRARLPKKRHGFTQEARVGGHKIFLRTGEYEDGTLGEIFIDMHKEGAAFRSLMNCFAMSVSVGLQYGVPLQTYVDQFTFTRFEPQGPVEGHPYVKFATSIVDFIFRALGVEYLHRYDLAHIKPELDSQVPPEPPSLRQLPQPPSLARRRGARRRHDAAAAHARGDRAQRGDERDAGRRRDGLAARRAARHDDGRRAGVRRVRAHHGAQRRLLQVPQLRQQHGMQLTLRRSTGSFQRRAAVLRPGGGARSS